MLLAAYWLRVDGAAEKIRGGYLLDVEDKSSLRIDSRFLGAWRNGYLPVGALTAALDALETLRALIVDAKSIPMLGAYPVIRAVFETSATAIFLLAPNKRNDRLRRAYQVAANDARLRHTFEVGRAGRDKGGKERADEKLEGVRGEIRLLVKSRKSMGAADKFLFPTLRYSTQVARVDGVLASDPAVTITSEVSCLSMWQLLSGLSHGEEWAKLEALERSGAVEDVADESAFLRLTTSPAVIAWFLERALVMLECALRLYGRRTVNAWNQLEDVREPAAVPYSQLGLKNAPA